MQKRDPQSFSEFWHEMSKRVITGDAGGIAIHYNHDNNDIEIDVNNMSFDDILRSAIGFTTWAIKSYGQQITEAGSDITTKEITKMVMRMVSIEVANSEIDGIDQDIIAKKLIEGYDEK